MPEPFTAEQRANLSALIAEGADVPGALRLVTAIPGQALPPLPASAYPPHALPIRQARPARRSLHRWLLNFVVPPSAITDWIHW